MSLNSIRSALGLMGTPGGLSTPPRAGRLPVGRSEPKFRSPLGSVSSEKWKEGFSMWKDSRGCELFLEVRSLQFGAFLTALPDRRYVRHTSEDLPARPAGGRRDKVSPVPARDAIRRRILSRVRSKARADLFSVPDGERTWP